MIKEYINKKIFNIGFKKTIKIKSYFKELDNLTKHNIKKFNFGNKNPNCAFLIIKRTPGAGFFSNLAYVIQCLKFADKNNLIPIVDMENFPTNYNQNKNLMNKKNIWELYFEQTCKYKLKDVYKSKNVYISSKNLNFRLEIFKNKKNKSLFDKYIKINNQILKKISEFKRINFKKQKILGIHFRGTDQKIAPNHAYPPTIYEIEKIIEKKLFKENYDKIFLLTEQQSYYRYLKKKYCDYIISYDFYRSNDINDFTFNKRKNHKNLLGMENLIEAVTLSKCNEIVYCETNISLFSIFYSNFKIKKLHINKGIKSSNKVLAFLGWYKIIFMQFLNKNLLKN